MSNSETNKTKNNFSLSVSKKRRSIWYFSGFLVLISLIGLIISSVDPSIRFPLRPGLDFTGGTQIKLERKCLSDCNNLDVSKVNKFISDLSLPIEDKVNPPNLYQVRVQKLDNGKILEIRLPFLSASQGKFLINSLNELAGPFDVNGQSVEAIGPSLGANLLRTSLVSLGVAFTAIAIYITYRYDRIYAFLALLALAHDLIIVCGVFAWLGVFISLEVDRLFAVSLLTIAGYSVNDTVVVFDRIRKEVNSNSSINLNQNIDSAVSRTLTRTLYTSGTTLLPLLALIIFGGNSLFWFAVSLSLGVIVGSWSSIALAPSILSIKGGNYLTNSN